MLLAVWPHVVDTRLDVCRFLHLLPREHSLFHDVEGSVNERSALLAALGRDSLASSTAV